MKRSHFVLLGGVALAIAVGAAAALLAPEPSVIPSGPGNLLLPVSSSDSAPDPRVLQAGLLERLIVDAETAEDPAVLPSLSTFVLLVERSPQDSGWIVARLAREDVSGALAAAFAGGLPSARGELDGAVHDVLIRHLEGEDEAARREAVAVLRARGALDGRVDRSCDCVIATYAHGGAAWKVTYERGRDGFTTVERGGAVDTSGDRL